MKKIMFSDRYGLTEAVLKGRKTMTRRIVPIGLYNQTDWKAISEGDYEAVVDGEGYYHDIRLCGQYQIGEEVAVAQSYSNLREVLANRNFKRTDALYDKFYRAMQMGEAHDGMPGWDNKMFVRADLMPHRIRITDMKVEQLQDISEEDAMREGIFKYEKPPLHHECDPFAPWPPYVKPYKHDHDNLIYRCSARWAFACLIDKVNGGGTWNSNPWVFAYTFEQTTYNK